jgi:hypothetical protein
MPAADCERLVEGWLAQPANAVSSLAFVLVALVVPMLARRRSGVHEPIAVAMAVSLVLVGIGSVAFHGPGGPVSNWIHDASITILLALVAVVEIGRWAGWTTRPIVAGWVVVSAAALTVELVRPTLGDDLNPPLAVVAVLGIMVPLVGSAWTRPSGRSKWVLAALGLVGTGAVIMLLSRTGGPLCSPDAVMQGHALWHLFAATGLGIYAVAANVKVPAASP